MNICKIIYDIGANGKIYGTKKGICRITGVEGVGINFDNWVKNTFNDHDRLYEGTIISNEAAFCFDEDSEIIKLKTNRDKNQRFRTYSHVVLGDEWYCLTKADKRQIFELIVGGADIVCLTDTGQKHVLFKHKFGMWQLDDLFVKPDIELLKFLHSNMCELLNLGFSQTEIITGNYLSGRLLKVNLAVWKGLEQSIKEYRSSGIFDFTSFMLFTNKSEYVSEEKKNEVKQNNNLKQKQQTLWD